MKNNKSEERDYKLKSGFLHNRMSIVMIPFIIAIILIVWSLFSLEMSLEDLLRWETISLVRKIPGLFASYIIYGFILLGVGFFLIGVPYMFYARWRAKKMWSEIPKDRDN